MSATGPARSQFVHFQTVSTRWTDNDVYGHVNNAIYYQYFDSVINAYLIESGALNLQGGAVVGFIVSSSCDFYAPVAYPSALTVGVAVTKLGRSSVTYATAVFVEGQETACASGSMVHVFVDAATQRPTEMPEVLRGALLRLMSAPG
jgi:acyl-CoA thioester hydrolase